MKRKNNTLDNANFTIITLNVNGLFNDTKTKECF